MTVTTTGTGPRGCDNDGVDGTSGGGRRRPRTPARPGRAPRHALGTPRVRRSRARHPCRGDAKTSWMTGNLWPSGASLSCGSRILACV